MSLIKIILIVGTLGILVGYLAFFRSVFRDRLLAILLSVAALGATVFPDMTTVVAQRLGVGRGTDLVFYLFALVTVYILVLLYSKISRLERTQTELVRALAVKFARRP